jgi:hypothetical protein
MVETRTAEIGREAAVESNIREQPDQLIKKESDRTRHLPYTGRQK